MIVLDLCYQLTRNDEAFSAFKPFKLEVENMHEKKIKALRSYCGGEYFSNDFSMVCERNGIIHECSAPYTLQQNGVAKEKAYTS